MRLATETLGVQSERPSASDVAPPPSDKPVASPLHREISARPSNSVVAPPPTDEPTATPLQRFRDCIKEIHAETDARSQMMFDRHFNVAAGDSCTMAQVDASSAATLEQLAASRDDAYAMIQEWRELEMKLELEE